MPKQHTPETFALARIRTATEELWGEENLDRFRRNLRDIIEQAFETGQSTNFDD